MNYLIYLIYHKNKKGWSHKKVTLKKNELKK